MGDGEQDRRSTPLAAAQDALDRLIPAELRHDAEARLRSRVLVASSLGIGLLAAVVQTIRVCILPITASFWSGAAVTLFLFALPWIQWIYRSVRFAGGLLSLALVIALPLIHYQVHHFPAPLLNFFPAVPVLVTFFVGAGWGLAAALAVAASIVALAATVPWTTAPEYARFVPLFTAFAVAATMTCYLLAAVYERNRRRNEVGLGQINRELTAARARAEAADRRKTEFLQHMSHELRTPLNAIIGYSELLGEQLADAEPHNDAEKIGAASRQLLALINDLLDISRIEAGAVALRFEPFALATLVDAVADALMPLVTAGGNRLELAVTPDVGDMRGDYPRMQQVLVNLVGNACKFTRDGVITIRCWPGPGDRVHFEVRDTGVGIPPAMLARIFEPFVQADAPRELQRQGTGLGLAITRTLIEHLGGAITVQSAVGVGSTFAFDLPRAEPAPPTAPLAAPPMARDLAHRSE